MNITQTRRGGNTVWTASRPQRALLKCCAVATVFVGVVILVAGHRWYISPLHLSDAIAARDIRSVHRILDAGADPNGSHRLPALIFATLHNQKDVCTLLLSYGARPDWRDTEGGTALRIAAGNRGGIAVVRLLLEHGADPNMSAMDPTPLGEAIMMRDDDTAEALILAGAKCNVASSNFYPLAGAASHSHIAMMRLLLKHGAQINGQDHLGTALMAAAYMGRLDAVKFLLRAGADPRARNAHGESAASIAAQAGNLDIARVLWDLETNVRRNRR